MRLSAEEKAEIVLLVSRSKEGVNRSLKSLGIHKRTFTIGITHIHQKGLMDLVPNQEVKGSGIIFLKFNVI